MSEETNIKYVPALKSIAEPKEHHSFREMLDYVAESYTNDSAFITKKKGQGSEEPEYTHITYSAFRDDVIALSTGMIKHGLVGKRIAIIGNNSYAWYLTYYTVLCDLGICIPLDKGLPYDELEISLIKSEADCLVFDNAHAELAKMIMVNEKTNVTELICTEDGKGFVSLPGLMEKGREAISNGDRSYYSLTWDTDSMQVILFTSGTTSKAKAVMLSQRNLLSNIYMLDRSEDIRRGDVNIAFLPFHHTFGSTCENMMLSLGVTTVFPDGLKYVQKNLKEYKVSVFVCVPLLIEAMYGRLQSGIDKKGMRQKFEKALKLSKFLLKFNIDVRRKLFSSIIDELGGELRYIVSGAAAMSPDVVKGYADIGIEVVQGYGMTEASPVISSESIFEKRAGSIGHSMPGLTVAVIDQNEEGIGELVCKGPNTMLGYYKDEEATAEIYEGGWLHTGDLARIDEDGFIFLCGRKKNVIVLKSGKNVYPEEIEEHLNALPYVVECMVYGVKRREDSDSKDIVPAAKIVYDPSCIDEDILYETVQKDIDMINEGMPSYKNLHRFELTDVPMEKTTTGKIKRYAQK